MMSVLFSGYRGPEWTRQATWFQKRRIPRVLAVIFVYLIAFFFSRECFILSFWTLLKSLLLLPTNLLSPGKAVYTGTVDKIFGTLPSLPETFWAVSWATYPIMSAVFPPVFGIRFRRSRRSGLTILIIVLSFLSVNAGKRSGKFLEDSHSYFRHENYAVGLWQRWKKKIGLWLSRLTDIARFYCWRFAVYRAYFIAGWIRSDFRLIGVSFLSW